MNEFTGIEGLDGWRAKLESLLADAKQIASEDDLAKRIKMSERLTNFIVESRPNSTEIQKFDKIAEETATALLLDSIEKRLAAITRHTGAFRRLTKKFEIQAEQNKEIAESIGLKNIISTVNSATETINSATKLRDSLRDNARENEIADLINETVSAVEKLRSNLGDLL